MAETDGVLKVITPTVIFSSGVWLYEKLAALFNTCNKLLFLYGVKANVAG